MGSIQPYKDTYNEELALYQAQISPEEAAKREKDVRNLNVSLCKGWSWYVYGAKLNCVCVQAEELDKKLRHIVEDLPDREYKRMGSMAGANSRTFDTYRRDKRREQERLKMLEQEEREEERKRKFQVCGVTRVLSGWYRF
jgi:hypothetical protein